MGVGFRPASEAERIGKDLIGKHFPDIEDSGVRIVYAFRSEAQKVKGKLRLGECKKVGGFGAWLAQDGPPSEDHMEPADVAFYALVFAEDAWQALTPHQRTALVHHELMHVLIEEGDEEGVFVLKVQSHDVEEFAETVKLFGVWRPDLEYFLRTAGDSLQLPFGEAPES